MKLKKMRVVAGVLVLAAAAAGVWFWRAGHGDVDKDHLVLFGNVDIRQVQLAFNDSERISTVQAQEGDRVQAGQLLATLDTRRFAAGVADREARVAAQREVVAVASRVLCKSWEGVTGPVLSHTVKHGKKDSFTAVAGCEGTHGSDPSTHFDKQALDDIGGAQTFPMRFGA